MKTPLGNGLRCLPPVSLLLVALYAVGFPLVLVGHYTHTFEATRWLGFAPELLWRGQVWRLLTYAFVANGIVDYVVSLFWLATLVAVLGRNWSGTELWWYSMLVTFAGALLLCLLPASMHRGVIGNAAMLFGLLAAWYRLYGRERLILLGLGELSVRQAALLVGFVELLVCVFCLGLLVTGAMLLGGLVGWVYLALRGKTAFNRRGQVVQSARVARLEL